MADQPLHSLLRRVRSGLGAPAEGVTDADLLGRFLAHLDDAAFELLVRRHERMVWGVCRHTAGNHHDAEDAFQATFLVLAKKASSVARRASLAAWLHQVAYRAALRARKRRSKPTPPTADLDLTEPGADLERRELRPLLDRALAGLPEQQRAAVVLCYLEGKTYAEAARELGCPKGTLSIRLTRARQQLRHTLTRLGVSLPAGALATLIGQQAAAAPPPVAAHASARVAALAEGVLRGMLLARLKAPLTLLLTLGLLAGGVLGYQARAPRAEPAAAPAHAAPPEAALPAGVLARLGSTHLRHADTVRDLAFLPDGKSLVAADRTSVRLWDSATGREVRRFGDGARSVSLSADGKLLAAAPEYSGTFRIWEVATGRLVRTIDGPEWGTVALSPDGRRLAAIGANAGRTGLGAAVHLWDVRTGRRIFLPGGHAGIVWSLAFSPDGSRLYSGGADNTIRVWDALRGRELGQIGPPKPVCHLAVSPDGRLLASVGMHYDKYTFDKRGWRTFNVVHLWDTQTRKKVGQITGPGIQVDQWGFPSDGFNALAFTPDGKTLVTVGVGNVIRLWDVVTRKERRQLELPGTRAYAVAVSPDGKTLAAGDNVLHLWDVRTGRQRPPQPGHQAELTAVAVAPDGRTVATAGRDRTIRLWDPAGREVRRLDSRGVLLLAFAGGRLVSSGPTGTRVWDTATGRELHRFPGVDSDLGIRWALSPDGKTVAQALRFEAVSLWDTATGKQLRELPEEMVMGVAFSPDSRTLLLCNGDRNVHLYRADGKRLRGFPTLPRQVYRSYQDVVFSPDARWVALWSYRHQAARTHVRVHLFDTARGREVRHFEDLGRPVGFSPDSRLVACRSTEDDRHVHLVEVATGKLVRRLAGPGAVRGLAFFPDGRRLVTAGSDATALVWDLTGLAGKQPRRSAQQCEQRWAELADPDPGRAHRAGAELASTPEGVQLLRKRLRPAARVAPAQVARWIRELDDDEFTVRSAAAKALEGLGGRAEEPLRQALQGGPSPEVRRRLQALLKKLDNPVLAPEQLRSLRAVATLESAGSAEARRLLADLAGGAPGSLRTREAKAALGRLGSR